MTSAWRRWNITFAKVLVAVFVISATDLLREMLSGGRPQYYFRNTYKSTQTKASNGPSSHYLGLSSSVSLLPWLTIKIYRTPKTKHKTKHAHSASRVSSTDCSLPISPVFRKHLNHRTAHVFTSGMYVVPFTNHSLPQHMSTTLQ